MIYLVISSGVVISIHYCMGKKASVEYGYKEDKGCGICGMKEKQGCCHNEFKVVKLDDSHQAVKADWQIAPLVVESPLVSDNVYTGFLRNTEFLSLKYHSPPDPKGNSIYLHHRVLRV